MFDDEDLYSAVAQFRQDHPWCDICWKAAHDNCPHPKNGYCAQFRLIAESDRKEVNMKKVNFEIKTS